jgi:hypothetical protein
MLNRRLQVLLDEDRQLRLQAEATRRGVSVGALVREAIDLAFPSTHAQRQAAATLLLNAAEMPVPDPEGLRDELDALRTRRA